MHLFFYFFVFINSIGISITQAQDYKPRSYDSCFHTCELLEIQKQLKKNELQRISEKENIKIQKHFLNGLSPIIYDIAYRLSIALINSFAGTEYKPTTGDTQPFSWYCFTCSCTHTCSGCFHHYHTSCNNELLSQQHIINKYRIKKQKIEQEIKDIEYLLKICEKSKTIIHL
ncbi:MAG TPA: hypothetical protein VGW78_00185 [Candidatus Babeliales bacterium]|jgi:hypothetical protein|nr:hypothetical protein [Candidatus Babeliales bacterium]